MLFFLRVYVIVEALKLGCQAACPKERLHLILGSNVVYHVFRCSPQELPSFSLIHHRVNRKFPSYVFGRVDGKQ